MTSSPAEISRFIYVMDPMCSWCWAFRPSITALQQRYPETPWLYLMGGLAPDSEEPMAEAMQAKLISVWQQIEQRTGTRFNFDFWKNNTPRRSTYPACRAVITADSLLPGSAGDMILAIQQAYYTEARNPSDLAVLCALAEQLGIDPERFEQRLNSAETEEQLQQQIIQGQRLGAQGFPALFLQTERSIEALSYGYAKAEDILRRVATAGRNR
ncbi:DsbA family protein [Neptuniibacter halophilus]|uniref:DsbA family protein n=1 Tax=Neptuniibacter halophilus TaxID=651666 RepID=UPI002573E9B8|nr:DsbA family protein [Neptuniibacter halophilus]